MGGAGLGWWPGVVAVGPCGCSRSTNTAGVAAALAWMLLENLQRGKPTAVGGATGAVAGLVAITPAAGYVSPLTAILIGFAAAVVCNGALQLKNRLGLDDTLDVLPVDGMAGLVDTLLTGVFAQRVPNPAGADGLITGRIGQLWIQIQAAGFTILWVGVGTYAVLKVIGAFVPLRLNDPQERQGADIHAHGEEAYNTEFTS